MQHRIKELEEFVEDCVKRLGEDDMTDMQLWERAKKLDQVTNALKEEV